MPDTNKLAVNSKVKVTVTVLIKLERPSHKYPCCDPVDKHSIFPVTTTHNISWVEFMFPTWDLAGYNLYKICSILDIVVNSFRTIYNREISLDEGMLGWRCHFQVRLYNPCKITNFDVQVWMVCESSTGYVCNLQICDDKCEPLTEMWVFYSSLMKGRVTSYTKTIITIVSIKQMNYYRN